MHVEVLHAKQPGRNLFFLHSAVLGAQVRGIVAAKLGLLYIGIDMSSRQARLHPRLPCISHLPCMRSHAAHITPCTGCTGLCMRARTWQVEANKEQLCVCKDCAYEPEWIVGDGEDAVRLAPSTTRLLRASSPSRLRGCVMRCTCDAQTVAHAMPCTGTHRHRHRHMHMHMHMHMHRHRHMPCAPHACAGASLPRRSAPAQVRGARPPARHDTGRHGPPRCSKHRPDDATGRSPGLLGLALPALSCAALLATDERAGPRRGPNQWRGSDTALRRG